jgi:hypothetical protein
LIQKKEYILLDETGMGERGEENTQRYQKRATTNGS